MRVLVVEDEHRLADAVATGLRREGMAVDVVYDGTSAGRRLAVSDYDVVVLDRDLPGMHGDDVCRDLVVHQSGTRVLMLTAASEVTDRVDGLGLGADDYLGKPFVFAELVARVRALGRRSRQAVPPVLERGGLRLDPARQQVTRDGRPVLLGLKELGAPFTCRCHCSHRGARERGRCDTCGRHGFAEEDGRTGLTDRVDTPASCG